MLMKFVYAQSAHKRFRWELTVALDNLYALDPDADVLVLFADVGRQSQAIYDYIASRYPKAEVHMYLDTRKNRSYSATYRPFLWYCYLTEDPKREQNTYFQVESDVIFRELPDFSKIPYDEHTWYGSDCSSYIDYKYLINVEKGPQIVDMFARILEVDKVVIEQTEGVGAHWILCKPTAEYWLKVLKDCNKLHAYLQPLNSNIQKWTAEMWAQLYAAPYFGIEQKIHHELDFAVATDHISRWGQVKIYHNAGVVGADMKTLFYKGAYYETEPFGQNLDWVNRDKCSRKYIEAIKSVMV